MAAQCGYSKVADPVSPSEEKPATLPSDAAQFHDGLSSETDDGRYGCCSQTENYHLKHFRSSQYNHHLDLTTIFGRRIM